LNYIQDIASQSHHVVCFFDVKLHNRVCCSLILLVRCTARNSFPKKTWIAVTLLCKTFVNR